MKKGLTLLMLFCAGTFLLHAQNKYPEIDIPYTKYVLDNGLTLIVHEDHKSPIIAFNVWYHVGSKNEKPGKTGFAHLFEHLMFNGSQHFNDDFFKLMDKIGATEINGTTNNDRTNYFEDFPVSALDKVLWAESDRMGFMVNAIDSAKLAEQRGVVQNEKRQGENEPYSVSQELTAKSTYPSAHPYSWTVIGSLEDLDAASLDDVKGWFKSHYGPNNSVVVIAGDIKPQEAYEKVKKYFGDIPASPPESKQEKWVAKMTGTHYQVAQDRVPQARLEKTWNIPGWGTKDAIFLNLLTDVLTSGKTSRLYKRLVYDSLLASNVNSYTDDKEIAGQFVISADAKPGVELVKLNEIINQELKKIFSQGVTTEELERAKTRYFSNFIKGVERIGGFGGKSDILALSATYGGSADYYKTMQKIIKSATPADIKKSANDWLTDGEYVLQIVPFGNFSTIATTLDRNEQPSIGAAPVVKFPDINEFTLSNGLKVSLVTRTAVPVINMSLMVNAGYAADQFGLPGLALLTGNMITEGTKTKTSLQISDRLADLGANLYGYSNLDNSYLNLNALKTNFDASLNLFADVLINPTFPQKDFVRVQKEQLLRIKQEEASPFSMGLRLLPGLLYGSGHAYSNSFTGSGTTESVNKISRNDVVKFHDTWFVPNNVVLVVVGDITANQLKTKLENAFALWKKGTVPEKNIKGVAVADKPAVYIIDKPGALQSIILAAEISTSATDPDYEALKMTNRILGGEFTSRINMNLRENKHWSYGAGSVNLDAKGPGFFVGYAPVQTDKTKESITEMLNEMRNYIGDKPASEEEFKKVQNNAVSQLPGIWETNDAVMNTLQDAITYNRGNTYLSNYASMLQHLNISDIQKAAVKMIKPNNLVWVIVGDREKIEKGIKDLKLGPIKYLNVEGEEIK
ncbi:MAG: pitrilysin family protein [Ginsengibacter sp.]